MSGKQIEITASPQDIRHAGSLLSGDWFRNPYALFVIRN
jgi:hypothetical protein